MELQGKRVAILVEDGYEDRELWYPTLRLREAGAHVPVVATGAARYPSAHAVVGPADPPAAAGPARSPRADYRGAYTHGGCGLSACGRAVIDRQVWRGVGGTAGVFGVVSVRRFPLAPEHACHSVH